MEEMELREYWTVIRKRWIIVLILPVIAIIVSGVLSFFVITPQYQANTTLLVNEKPNANQSLQYQAIMANQALVNTYSAIIKSASIEGDVIQQLHLPYSTVQLDKMITVSSPTQSEVIDVKVVEPDHAQAVDIANALAKSFQSKAQALMDVQNVQIVDEATRQRNPQPVKPNKKLNIAIALILALMVGIGLAFLLEYMDDRIRSEEAVQQYLRLPVLGTVMEYDSP